MATETECILYDQSGQEIIELIRQQIAVVKTNKNANYHNAVVMTGPSSPPSSSHADEEKHCSAPVDGGLDQEKYCTVTEGIPVFEKLPGNNNVFTVYVSCCVSHQRFTVSCYLKYLLSVLDMNF